MQNAGYWLQPWLDYREDEEKDGLAKAGGQEIFKTIQYSKDGKIYRQEFAI